VQGVAVLTSVAREALAQTGRVVALAATAALVGVVVGRQGGVHLADEVTGVGTGLNRDTGQLRGTAIVALIVMNNQVVLGTLHVVTGEGHKEIKLEGGNVLGFSGGGSLAGTCHSGLGSDGDTINNLIGEHQESKLHIVRELIVVETIGVAHHNGDGGEGLVQLGLERKSECLRVDVLSLNLREVELDSLDVLVKGQVLVNSVVQDIVAVRAHSLGAVKVAIQGIAHASTLLVAVPIVVGEGLRLHEEALLGIIVPGGSVVKVFDVLAGTVAGAVVGAGSALAALTLVAIEALALTRVTSADTSARALQVLVEVAVDIGGINPRDLVGAHSLRAISTVVRKTNTPVVVAGAHIIDVAGTVTRAVVVASSVGRHQEGSKNSNREKHC
jgi:hypothetical protein